MDFKVIWSDEAIGDLHDLCSYIAQRDPDAARRMGHGILDHVRILASFPFIGPTYPRGADGPLRQSMRTGSMAIRPLSATIADLQFGTNPCQRRIDLLTEKPVTVGGGEKAAGGPVRSAEQCTAGTKTTSARSNAPRSDAKGLSLAAG